MKPRLIRRAEQLCWAAILAVLPPDLPALTAAELPDRQLTAAAWPEADRLFRTDPRWRGGDAASSVDLGGGRVLWLFGDSFVAPPDSPRRPGSTMIKNSVGIQTGYDPTTAGLRCFWRGVEEQPAPFFAGDGEEWVWPAGGDMVGGNLIVFFMRIRSSDEGFGFAVSGSAALRIGNPADPPGRWRMQSLQTPESTFGVLLGSGGVSHDATFLYAFSSRSEFLHAIQLVRWPLAQLSEDDLTSPQWWVSDQWVDHATLSAVPPALIRAGQSEFSTHYEPRLSAFLQIQSGFFPLGPVGFRHAPRRTGPWSDWEKLYQPTNTGKNSKQVFYYAGKAHPELHADRLAVTYCSNVTKLGPVVNDESVYYPRFLRITW